MPLVHRSADQYLLQQIAELSQRVADLEGQQNWGVRDHTTTQRVQGGLLRDGGFGVAVWDATTQKFHRVSPPQTDSVPTELNTASTSFVTIGGPQVTATVGEAGSALVIPSSVVGIDGGSGVPNSPWQGFVGVMRDGALTSAKALIGVSVNVLSISGTDYVLPIQQTATNPYLWTGLAQGSHTFRCVYRSVFGQAIHFSANSLVVIPY